jgi:hypothetical protein
MNPYLTELLARERQAGLRRSARRNDELSYQLVLRLPGGEVHHEADIEAARHDGGGPAGPGGGDPGGSRKPPAMRAPQHCPCQGQRPASAGQHLSSAAVQEETMRATPRARRQSTTGNCEQARMTTRAAAERAETRELERSVSWTGRERLRCVWYLFRLTIQEMNYATRRMVELQMRLP